MFLTNQIKSKISSALTPIHLEVINESGMHNVPPGSQSHFKLVIVSEIFDGKSLVARHRLVNDLLAEELCNAIHALALHTMTPTEWDTKKTAADSPKCFGDR